MNKTTYSVFIVLAYTCFCSSSLFKPLPHKDLLKLLKCCLVFLQQTLHLFAVDFEFLNVRFTCLFGHGFEVMELFFL